MAPLGKRTPKSPTQQLPANGKDSFIQHVWAKPLPGTVQIAKNEIDIHLPQRVYNLSEAKDRFRDTTI